MNFYVMPTEEGLPARAILHGGPDDVVAVWDFAKGWQIEGQELPSELADDITARCVRLHVPGFENVRAPFGHLAVVYGSPDYESDSATAELETAMADMLTNVMHYAHREGLDFDAALARARTYYADE